MDPIVYIGDEALSHLFEYCTRAACQQLTLVADENTFAVLGKRIDELWQGRGWDTRTIVLKGTSVIADEYRIMQVLAQSVQADQIYLAVGSGTITDIVRFASFVTRNPFIAVPTAPSVDAFTSIGAALAIGKTKQTLRAQPPVAVFADLDTLVAAPRPMIAAGFADILGKFTSLADWKLGHLIWGERYNDAIAQRAQTALYSCLSHLDEIARGSARGVRCLMDALIESGSCIADLGSSESASGSEHHLSHYWEMKLLWENRPALLHGAKVGVGAILIAQLYEKVRGLDSEQVRARLNRATMPQRENLLRFIETGYRTGAENVIASHAPFLKMSASDYDALKRRIVEHWTEILEIAATVPLPHVLAEKLGQVNAPSTPRELGLDEQDVARALEYAPYLRNRFTVLKLAHLLDIVGENDLLK